MAPSAAFQVRDGVGEAPKEALKGEINVTVAGGPIGKRSTLASSPEGVDASARMCPLLLMLYAAITCQPLTILSRSWVPVEAVQTHPPTSLCPTTIPLLLRDCGPTLLNLAPGGSGISTVP